MSAINGLIYALLPMAQSIVPQIEQSAPTDQYADAIAEIVKKADIGETDLAYIAVGVALERAGADKHAIDSALKALGKTC